MKKVGVIVIGLALLVALASCASTGAEAKPEVKNESSAAIEEGAVLVSTASELKKAVAVEGAKVVFAKDITITTSADVDSLILKKNVTIDLNGFTLKMVDPAGKGVFLIYREFGSQTIKNGKIDASAGSAIRNSANGGSLILDGVTGISGKYFMVQNAVGDVQFINCKIANTNTPGKGGNATIYGNNVAAGSTYLFDGCELENQKASVLYLNDMVEGSKSTAVARNTTFKTNYGVCSCFTRFVDIAYEPTCVFDGVKVVGVTGGYSVAVPEGVTAKEMSYGDAKK